MWRKTNLKVRLTGNYQIHLARIHEISKRSKSDFNLVVCRDELLPEDVTLQRFLGNKIHKNIGLLV